MDIQSHIPFYFLYFFCYSDELECIKHGETEGAVTHRPQAILHYRDRFSIDAFSASRLASQWQYTDAGSDFLLSRFISVNMCWEAKLI